MLASCGEPFGTTWISTALPFGLGMGGLTCATSGSRCSAASRRVTAGVAIEADGTSLASRSGPLKPGPNPSLSKSYARRVVNDFGSLPASATPSRNERNGTASRSRMRSPPIATGHGFRWTMRLQRAQKLFSVSVRRLRAPGRANRSIVRPTKPSTAGNSVIAAAMTNKTASDAPTANPRMNDTPMRKRPSSEMTTVPPANSTARPLVSIECTTASSGSAPSCNASRYRVLMNKA